MIQIDIDMPTDCASCWIRQNMGCKIANASGWLNNRRDDKCPLKEQEAVEPIYIENPYTRLPVSYCSKCREPINKYITGNQCKKKTEYCHYCGQAVKWEC